MPIALAADTEALPGYRCVRRLGRSSRGETWLIKTEDEAQHVLKWVIEGAGLRHARKLTSYRHPFLINWERTELNGADLYLIAEWAEDTLEAQLAESMAKGDKGIHPDILFRALEELAEVLDYLHTKQQLIHGRLSLRQIGIQHGHVKLLDWGLLQPEKLAYQDWALASLQTTAPEVLLGKPEPASDQFSLAALYIQACTGNLPLPATSIPELFHQRQEHSYDCKAIREPERVVLTRALHQEPSSRFPSCIAFVKALSKVREPSKSISKPTIVIPEVALPAVKQEAKPPEPVVPEAAPPIAHQVPEQVPSVIIESLMAVEEGVDSRHPDSAFLNLNNLAYHSKVQSYGVLTPTMIIGLGRHGQNVLHEFSQLCHECFDGINQLPHLRVVALENGPTDHGSPGAQKPGALGKEHYFPCSLPEGEALKTVCQDSQVKTWLPSGNHVQQPGLHPSHGRLAFALSYNALRKRLQEECKTMLRSESMMQSTQATGLSIRQDLTPAFYLVAGLDEGISSGIIADVAYLLRSIIAETGWGNGKLFGLFFLPHDEQSEQVKSQAYASLVELNHYTQESQFSARYTGADELHFAFQPFDDAFFNKLPVPSHENANSTLYRNSANWLMRDVTSELGSLRQASRETTRAFASNTSPWYGHGLTALRSSHDQADTSLKNKLLGKLIGYWLDHNHEREEAIWADGERFVNENIHSASALLERFQHLAAIVLGCEPARLIDEWVAPLRKGAAARPSLEALARDIMHKVESNFGTSAGYQSSPVLAAFQQEAEGITAEITKKINPFLMQYLDRPGQRMGAAMRVGQLILQWVNHHLGELQARHLVIHQDMIRSERTITQMIKQEERSFAIMGKQRLVSQIAQDLMDYPGRVLKEDIFARAVHVFQDLKNAIEDSLRRLYPAEKILRDLQTEYLAPVPTLDHLLLDGERTFEDRCNALIKMLPEDIYVRLDADLSEALKRFHSNYPDVCMGHGPSFKDVFALLDNSLEECLEGLLPSEDAAEQLLAMPSQAVVEQLRQSYRDARPDLMENKRSRQGAFCLLLTPNSDAGQELLQMAQATLPQIVAAPEGQPGEILLYRETGCLLPHEIYPEGKKAYDLMVKDRATSPHSRFDIGYWHSLSSGENSEPHFIPTPSSFELP